ncbi:hypothetical protein SAMD00023353_0701510 [Rosellinia necatrix]|uniref:Uncharacterized protein n=1 Tax=Rosellinia necatrix TaxID=77044 RepID=A0A1S7ULW8_ROSNE|nr:hypothetical protein SAMD00023353_0701510 [Rosellinia necatrix]
MSTTTTNHETRPTPHSQAAAPRRSLFKGTLRPPSTQPACKSYTLTPASISEVSIRDAAEKQTKDRRSTAISSNAVPQPFVDPAVLQQRPHLS